jgi:hypothetical protein
MLGLADETTAPFRHGTSSAAVSAGAAIGGFLLQCRIVSSTWVGGLVWTVWIRMVMDP